MKTNRHEKALVIFLVIVGATYLVWPAAVKCEICVVAGFVMLSGVVAVFVEVRDRRCRTTTCRHCNGLMRPEKAMHFAGKVTGWVCPLCGKTNTQPTG